MIDWRSLSGRLELLYDGRPFYVAVSEAQRHEIGIPDHTEIDCISVGPGGITLRIYGTGTLRIEPARWQDWWEGAPEFAGEAALRALDRFGSWRLDHLAQEAVAAIEAGQTTFEDLRALPELFQHREIQRLLAERFASVDMPRRHKGKRTKLSAGHYELFHWLDHYRRTERASIEEAAAMAVENHPEHIPATWQEPADSLARSYKRIFQRHTPGSDKLE